LPAPGIFMICATTLSAAKDGVLDRPSDPLAASAAAPPAPARNWRRLACIAMRC